jgi:predicted kinase
VALLIILGGLPGSGKTTIARELARRTGAVHLRIDTIEHALRTSGLLAGPVNDAGYRIAYALAEDNLRLNHTVIADSVNPIAITREAWRAVVRKADAGFVEVEVVCSDAEMHRHRVETRDADIPGHIQPTWQQVTEREYEPWPEALQIDTAVVSAEEGAEQIARMVSA